MIFYKYHGAGNDFLIADGRNEIVRLSAEKISALCERRTGIGADGVMILENSDSADFRMRYYNSDGSGGMMCGNGGRCIVAFAADLGFSHFDFEAPDGLHTAQILSNVEAAEVCSSANRTGFQTNPKIVRLKMRDVDEVVRYGDDWFLNTGTRHLVRFVEDVSSCNVIGLGQKLRYDNRFAPEGVNVNFVQKGANNVIRLRTYEKGVEDETLACGTGIVASSLAYWFAGNAVDKDSSSVSVKVHARIADLSVEFTPSLSSGFKASNIWLTGPAVYVGKVDVEI